MSRLNPTIPKLTQPSIMMAGSTPKRSLKAVLKFVPVPDDARLCWNITLLYHKSSSPIEKAYAGHSNGMRMTGASHKASVFFLLEFEFDTTRYPTTGIIVNAGILVYIARPRKIPDNSTNRFLFMLILGHCRTLLFFGPLMYIANRIEDKSNGMCKVSKY